MTVRAHRSEIINGIDLVVGSKVRNRSEMMHMDEVTCDIPVEIGEHEVTEVTLNTKVSDACLPGLPVAFVPVHENPGHAPFGIT